MFAALLALAVLQAPPIQIEGVVVGSDLQPLAGARVLVACQPEIPWLTPGREVLADVHTGADGAFVFGLSEEWAARQAYKRAELFVLAPGHLLHTAEWSVLDLPVGRPLRIALLAASADSAARVRVVDDTGAPVRDALVVPATIKERDGTRTECPRELWRGSESGTDGDGLTTLPMPRDALIALVVEAGPGPGVSFMLPWGSKEPFPELLTLAAAQDWRVELDGPPPAGASVRASFGGTGGAANPGVYLQFVPPHVPLEGSPLRLPETLENPPFGLAGSDAAALEYRVERGAAPRTVRFTRSADTYAVRIPVVDTESRTPIAGAELTVMAHQTFGVVRTGADGVATFRCDAPLGHVVFVRAPDGYLDVLFPEELGFKRSDDGALVELPAFGLTREALVTGNVRDAHGRPVSGAWIVGRTDVTVGRGTQTFEVGVMSSADGAFTLRGVPAKLPCQLFARAGDGEGRALAQGGAPVELVLETLVAARGVLVDEVGHPIANAEVEVWLASPPRHVGGERRVALGGADYVTTDTDGRFETPRVMRAGERYGLRWSGVGAAPGGSDWLPAEELAEARPYTGIALHTRRGVLRDPSGAPIAGAELRVRRTGRSVESDATGRFELPGLAASGEVVVLVLPAGQSPDGSPRKKSFRGGVVVPAPDDADWLLPRLDGEGSANAAPPFDRARELELAQALLSEDFEAAVASGDESLVLRAAQRFARVDPAALLERVEAGLYETGWMRDFSLAYIADALNVRSPEEALAVTMRLERGMSRGLATLEAARELPPDAEREQLALVRADARTVTPPEHRIVVQARLAQRLLQLGEADVAREVLAEAVAIAATLPKEEWPGYARCVLGEVLATQDEAAGLALIDALEPKGDRGRHYGNLAHLLAASNPARAEELLAAIDTLPSSSWQSSTWRARVVHAMAPADPERAARIAQKDRTGYSDGMLALALRERDPDAARVALARAFERALALDARTLDWGDRAESVAALLPLAAELDPEHLRQWIERALWLPRPPAIEGFQADERGLRADATIAVYVARFDRELAGALIAPGLAAYRALDQQTREFGDWGALWAAAALVDPESASVSARACGARAAGYVGQVLALPPEERDAWVQKELVRLWRPGMVDI
jgi:hypothetical protein